MIKMPQLTDGPKAKGMGYNCEREELYEQTMQLKRTVNKLKKELSEAKSNLVKSEINNRNKEKIIANLTKDNEVEEQKEENMKKAQESSLVSLVKNKYKELKKSYKELMEENETLKANMKYTKIKEIQIETEVLQQEMQKVKTLYQHSQSQNKSNIGQLSEMDEIKSKFFEQHKIIESLQQEIQNSKGDNMHLAEEITKLKTKCNKKDETIKKQKTENQKLKSNNEIFLASKKGNEKFEMNYSEYMSRYDDLNNKLKQLQGEYKRKENECITQKKLID